jgi:hypothetical protein
MSIMEWNIVCWGEDTVLRVQIENILVPGTYLAIQVPPMSRNMFHIRMQKTE